MCFLNLLRSPVSSYGLRRARLVGHQRRTPVLSSTTSRGSGGAQSKALEHTPGSATSTSF